MEKCQQSAALRLAEKGKCVFRKEERVFGTPEDALRPSFIQFVNCKDVEIQGVTICDGPMWTIHPVYCENVSIDGVSVRTAGPNTDGIDPDSCRNIRISRCDFDCGDDCIALKSGLNEDGMRVGRSCENVEISDCVMRGGHATVAIGSELSGGIRNAVVRRCRISGVGIGIRVKTMPGRGGFVENVLFEDLEMSDISSAAIHFTTDYGQSTVRPQGKVAAARRGIFFPAVRKIVVTPLPSGGRRREKSAIPPTGCLFSTSSLRAKPRPHRR
ncbi:MAG: glycosyl hydrolase family 28 protein [Victivallaceae bacterium]|nr:glycosyl hydrolase family 28 protein [Victivallaceae bacterium]